MRRGWIFIGATAFAVLALGGITRWILGLPGDDPDRSRAELAATALEDRRAAAVTLDPAVPARRTPEEEPAGLEAADGDEEASPPLPEGPYGIRGVVTVKETGAPAAGAVVMAYREPPPYSDFNIQGAQRMGQDELLPRAEHSLDPLTESPLAEDHDDRKAWNDHPFLRTTSDELGRFEIRGIPSSHFYVNAEMPGHRLESTHEVDVTREQPVRALQLELVAGGRVEGRVLLPEGKPAASASVHLGQSFNPFAVLTDGPLFRMPATAQTDAEGEFFFDGVPPGESYTLSARMKGFAPPESRDVRVFAGQVQRIELTLPPGVKWQVQVVDPAGEPVQGARVKLRTSSIDLKNIASAGDRMQQSASADAQGQCEFAGMDAGLYRLEVSHEGFRTTTQKKVEVAPQDRPHVVTLERGLRLTGVVWDKEGAPVSGARVRAYTPASMMDMFSFENRQRTPWTDAAADGTFELTGLPDATLEVEASAEGYLTAKTSAPASGPPLEIRLIPRAGLEGIVVSRVTTRPVQDFTLEAEAQRGFSMDFMRWGEDLANKKVLPYHTENGKFRLLGMETGTYRITIKAPGHAAHESEPIELEEGQIRRGIIIYLEKESVIEGRVLVSATGDPIVGARVMLQSSSSNPMTKALENFMPGGAERSDEEGRYRIDGLGAGRYQVAVSAEGFAPTVLTVEVSAGQTLADRDVLLDRGGVIRGTCYGSDGQPQVGVRILANDATNTRFQSGESGPHGQYELAGLAPGKYTLTRMPGEFTFDDENFMSQFADGIETHSVALAEGEELEVDFGLLARGRGVVEGVVRQAGQPVKGAMVTAVGAGGGNQGGWHSTSTGETGAFRLEGLHAGQVYVQVQLQDSFAAQQFSAHSELVQVPAEGTAQVSFEIPGGAIVGRIVDAEGQPLAGVPVYAERASRGMDGHTLSSFARQRAGLGSSGEDGRFRLKNLPDASYAVVAGGSDIFGLTRSRHAFTTVDAVQVTGGSDADAGTIRLPPATSIRGSVHDGEGRPVVGASLFLRHADSNDRFLQRLSACFTDAGGSFVYEGIPPGTYDVICQSSGHATCEQRGVRVGEAGVSGVDLVALGGTAVYAVIGKVAGFDPLRLQIELVDPAGKVVNGLLGFADLSSLMFQSASPGEYFLGTFAAGTYTLRGSYQGKPFEFHETLAGEAEKRIPVSLP